MAAPKTYIKKIITGTPVQKMVSSVTGAGHIDYMTGVKQPGENPRNNQDFFVYDSAEGKWVAMPFTTSPGLVSYISTDSDLFKLTLDSAVVKGLFSASGDLTYDSATGQFSFDVETLYTKENFDSDLKVAGGGISIGTNGQNNQDSSAIAIGRDAGKDSQGRFAIAIGDSSGHILQGVNAIAIGRLAGRDSQVGGSIIINASGTVLNAKTDSGFYIDPIRPVVDDGRDFLRYNPITKEVVYSTDLHVDSARIRGLTGDSARFNDLHVDSAHITNLVADTINLNEVLIDSASISQLDVDSAQINTMTGDTWHVTDFHADSAKISQLDVDSANIHSGVASLQNLHSDSASIGKADIDSAQINILSGDTWHVGQFHADSAFISQADIDSAQINTMTGDTWHVTDFHADSAHITNLVADTINLNEVIMDSASIGQLDVDSAQINTMTGDTWHVYDFHADSANMGFLSLDSGLVRNVLKIADGSDRTGNRINVNDQIQIYTSGTRGYIDDSGSSLKIIAGDLNIYSNIAPSTTHSFLYAASDTTEIRNPEQIKNQIGINGTYVTKTTLNNSTYTIATGVGVTADSATINQISVPDGYPTGPRINVGTGDDLKIFHESGKTFIQDSMHPLMVYGQPIEIWHKDQRSLMTSDSGATVYGNITLTGSTLKAPSLFYIDPATIGTDSGRVIIKGDLQIDGTQTVVNSTTVQVDDKNLLLGDSTSDSSQADGGGIILQTTKVSPSILYNATTDRWEFNKTIYSAGLDIDSSHISQLDIDSAQINVMTGDTWHVGQFHADSASIGQADIDSAQINTMTGDTWYVGQFHADSASISQADIDSAQINVITGDSAHFLALHADSAHISNLIADTINLNEVSIDSAHISQINFDSARGGHITVDSAYIAGGIATFQDLHADSAHIGTLTGTDVVKFNSGIFEDLTVDSAWIKDGKADLDSADITTLWTSYLRFRGGHNIVKIGPNSGQTNQGLSAIAIGQSAGYANQGNYGIALGDNAGRDSQRQNSIAIGLNSGQAHQGGPTSGGAISIGQSSGQDSQGSYSIALGYGSGMDKQGTKSIAIGYSSSQYSQSTKSISIGNYAGRYFQDSSSIAIGDSAGKWGQGHHSIAIGPEAGRDSQGDAAIAIGYRAGQDSQGDAAIAIGTQAGFFTQGGGSIALGYKAGQDSQGIYGIAIGADAARDSQGNYAIAIGRYAGQREQGNNAIAIGLDAGQHLQGKFAIAIGDSAGQNSSGWASIAIGKGSLSGTGTNGQSTIAIGTDAGINGMGNQSVAIGRSAAGGATATSYSTVSIGYLAGETGQDYEATAIGYRAGRTDQGDRAVAIGPSAGMTTQGDYSIAIGEHAGIYEQNDDAIAIGRQAGLGHWPAHSNGGQGADGIAIGKYAQKLPAKNADNRGTGAIAIGSEAGENNQGNYSIAIGYKAGEDSASKMSIILNATSSALNTDGIDGGGMFSTSSKRQGFFVKPVREANTSVTANGPLQDSNTVQSLGLNKYNEIIALPYVRHGWARSTHDSTGTGQLHDRYLACQPADNGWGTGEYLIQISVGNQKIQSQKLMVMHDSVDAYVTSYAILTSDSSLGTFDAELTDSVGSGNSYVNILFNPALSGAKVTSSKTLIRYDRY